MGGSKKKEIKKKKFYLQKKNWIVSKKYICEGANFFLQSKKIFVRGGSK